METRDEFERIKLYFWGRRRSSWDSGVMSTVGTNYLIIIPQYCRSILYLLAYKLARWSTHWLRCQHLDNTWHHQGMPGEVMEQLKK